MSSRILLQLIILGLSIGLVFFYIQPKLAEIQELQAEADEYATAVARATEFNQLLNQLLNQINTLSRQNIENLEQFLPQRVDTVAVGRDIQAIALRSNMILTSLTNSETEQTENVRNIQDQFDDEEFDEFGNPIMQSVNEPELATTRFTVGVSGSYEDLISFLERLESNRYPLRAVELTVGAQTDELGESTDPTGTTLNAYSITIETYSASAPI
jgi:hypothetical protein